MSSLCKFVITLFTLVILQTNLGVRTAKGEAENDDLLIRTLNVSERVKNSTKWCSPLRMNTTAKAFEFGSAINTDMCCKTYGQCSDFIAPGESKFGLVNCGSYTRPSCKCAGEFFVCLNIVVGGTDDHDFSVATELGRKYFSADGDPCYNIQTFNCPNGYYDAANNHYDTNENDENFCADWMMIHWHNQRNKSYFRRYIPHVE